MAVRTLEKMLTDEGLDRAGRAAPWRTEPRAATFSWALPANVTVLAVVGAAKRVRAVVAAWKVP